MPGANRQECPAQARDARGDFVAGCAVGRASFELARDYDEVIGVDLSRAFIDAAETLRRRAGTKTQNPSEQVLVRRDDRVRLVKMAATVKTDDGAPEAK